MKPFNREVVMDKIRRVCGEGGSLLGGELKQVNPVSYTHLRNIDAWRENSNSSAMYERHSLDVWTDVCVFRTEFCRGEGQIECCLLYTSNIGQGLPELTPVEIVGYEVWEAGNPLALDNG